MSEASVIIPVFNGAKTVLRCLDALARQTSSAPAYEIIVVDDGSTDGTATVVEEWGNAHPDVHVTLISQRNAGPAAARNRGGAAATAPILLFTDADCAPEADWVEKMVSAFSSPDIAGVKGAYLSSQSGKVPRFVQAEYEDRYDRMRDQEQIDFVDTYSAGYRRDVFLGNGGFDTIFPSASVEDQEFSFRLAASGYRMVFSPEARVRHLHDETVWEYARRKFYIGYWKALVTRRYPERIVHDSHTPQALKAQMAVAGALVPAGVLSLVAFRLPRLRWAWRFFAASVALFAVLSASFQTKLAQRSEGLALVAPGLLFVRAVALGTGYLLGMIRFMKA